MTDTLWSDISSWQKPVNNSYPYHFICIRSNDGSFLDPNFNANIAWCRGAVKAGKLWGFMVYYFSRPGINGAQLLMNRVGKPDHDMAVMIDVEGANGQVRGDQSNAVNSQYSALVKWIGRPGSVVGYGNTGDLNGLWPRKPHGIRFVIAAYGSNPGYPGKFAHQFMDNKNTPPFGPSDFNSADGMSAGDLQRMFGFVAPKPPPPPPPPPSNIHSFDGKQTMLDVAKSRGYGTVAAWLAHEGNVSIPIGTGLISPAESLLAAYVPEAGTKWVTNA
jgi:hypothetical protein